MSEGRQHIVDAIEICQKILDKVGSIPEIERLWNQIKEGKEKLEALKDKVYLKTKKGISDAYLVLESAKALEATVEAGIDSLAEKPEAFLEELETQVSAFVTNVETLEGGTKSRAVVIT
jgi:hypothetical protein